MEWPSELRQTHQTWLVTNSGSRCRPFQQVAGLSYNLLLNLSIGQVCAGSKRKDGARQHLTTVVIGISQFDVSPLGVPVVFCVDQPKCQLRASTAKVSLLEADALRRAVYRQRCARNLLLCAKDLLLRFGPRTLDFKVGLLTRARFQRQ